MNETTNSESVVQETSSPEAPPPAAADKPATEAASARVVDTLCGLGATWAQVGIGIGKTALESSAKALERTAKALADLQEQLKPKSN